MKSDIRVFLCDNDNLRFFGEGPCRLLHLIEETGSLRAAALSMGMRRRECPDTGSKGVFT